MDVQRQDNQLSADMGCSPKDLPEAMDDRERWWERVRDIHADDDDDLKPYNCVKKKGFMVMIISFILLVLLNFSLSPLPISAALSFFTEIR